MSSPQEKREYWIDKFTHFLNDVEHDFRYNELKYNDAYKDIKVIIDGVCEDLYEACRTLDFKNIASNSGDNFKAIDDDEYF